MKKQFKRMAHLLLAAVLFVCLFAPAAQAAGSTLTIEVNDIYTENDQQYAALTLHNYTGARISFGWVKSCEIIVTTDKGMYSRSISSVSNEIAQGDYTLKLRLGKIPGTVQKIVITDLRKLDSRGLPGARLRNCVIYDTAEGITSFEGKFSFISLVSVAIIISVLLTVLFAVGMICLIIHSIKISKKATQQYAPYQHVQQSAMPGKGDGFTPPPGF